MLGSRLAPVLLLLAGCAAKAPPPAIPPVAPAGAVEPAPAPEPTRTAAVAAVPEWASVAAQKIVSHAESHRGRAYERLAYVADTWGPRLSGSLALEKAIDWAVATLAGDRLENARREKVMVPHWVRGKESARLVAPVERELVMLGLGGSVGTGGKPLRGEVLVLGNVDEVEARAADVAGKIVLFNQVMPPYDHEERNSFYGETVPARTHGATRAAKHGAKAVLIRSVTAHSLRSPHTGATRYEEGVRKIPAAALTVEDAELVSRFAARGKVELELRMAAKTLPDAESGNVVAELPGRERREEVVVIGGHIDSWDVGDGSTDDLSGCIIAMEAARMLRELGLVPRRTIRVVLFTNEENGLRGAEAYHAAHGKERHVAAIESDSGAGAPLGFTVAGSEEQVAALSVLAPLFVHTGAATIVAGGSGADIGVLVKDGALGLGLRPDGSHYFDLHHSPADTAEKIVPEHLQMNAAAMAIMAYVLAERE